MNEETMQVKSHIVMTEDQSALLRKELEEAKKDIAVWEEYAGKQNDKVIALIGRIAELERKMGGNFIKS